VLDEALTAPAWERGPTYQVPDGPHAALSRVTALDLDPAPGVLHGLTYPFAPDLEGMQSPLFVPMLYTLPRLNWERRVRWLRSMGLQAIVLFGDPRVPGLRLLDQTERLGVRTRLYAVADPAPPAWWPRRLIPAPSLRDVVREVSLNPDPVAEVTLDSLELPAHDPRGSVRLVASAPDRIELEVAGGGGVAVVRRAYQPLFVARAEGRRLRTLRVNLNLLGVVVPPGRHRVVLAVSAWPETVAGILALLALAGAAVAFFRRSGR
jgi:hypothetical protein